MKLHIALIAIACLVASSSEAQTIFADNFNADTVGANPSGFTLVKPDIAVPGTTNGSVGATVVSLGGGDNALNMFDYSTTVNARLEQDYTPQATAHLSLSFTRNANIVPTTTTDGLYVTFGLNGQSQGTSANRALDIRLFNDGTYKWERASQGAGGVFGTVTSASAGAFDTSNSLTFTTHTLDIYAYGATSGGAQLSYTGPDLLTHTLDPHSYSFYIDGVLQSPSTTGQSVSATPGDYGFYTSTFYSSTDLGRFGLVTGGANAVAGMDFNIDNVVLSAIPEPSTFALMGAGGFLLIGLLRRSRRSR